MHFESTAASVSSREPTHAAGAPEEAAAAAPDQADLRKTCKIPEGAGRALPLERFSQPVTFQKVLSSCLVIRHPRLASISKYLIACHPVVGRMLLELENMRQQVSQHRASGECPLSWVAPVDSSAYSTENNYDRNERHRVETGKPIYPQASWSLLFSLSVFLFFRKPFFRFHS